MPIELPQLIETVRPENTVLLFGAGSSVHSGAPTGERLSDFLAARFSIFAAGFTLGEVASLIERKASRKELVDAIRERLKNVHPTGGLPNLPLYD
jgi:hypothetical protein